MTDRVNIIEGHFNRDGYFYLGRTIFDEEDENFGYSLVRSSKGSATGERFKEVK